MAHTSPLRRSLIFAACLSSIGGARAASATVMVPLSIEDMALRSSAVVRGRVISTEAQWDTEHQRIYTLTELEVLDPIHSVAGLPKKITIRSLGGEVGEIGMKVSGSEKFARGEEVVVFLRKDPTAETAFQVIGMSQGKYRIEQEAKGRVIAVPTVDGLAFARPDATGTLKVDAATPLPGRIPLTELRDRIVSAIAKRSTPPATPGTTAPQVQQSATPATPNVDQR